MILKTGKATNLRGSCSGDAESVIVAVIIIVL